MLSRFRVVLSAFALLTFMTAGAVHAYAQDADEAEAQADAEEQAKKQEARRAAKAAAPPDALPGAASSEEDGGHSNMDLEPTAALFDAINRGSLGGAKEAVNRGADMNGHNVLGQTPLDMSIDLSRNDIMFFLLSMRTIDDGPATATTFANHGVDVKNGSGHLSIGGRVVQHRDVSLVSARRAPDNGGTAKPNVGFLGFGGS